MDPLPPRAGPSPILQDESARRAELFLRVKDNPKAETAVRTLYMESRGTKCTPIFVILVEREVSVIMALP